MSDSLTIRSTVPSALNDLDYILLDGSGSMVDKWWPMLGAIDAYIAGVKDNVDGRCILHIFDSTDLEYVARDCSLRDWQTFDIAPVGMHGGTTPLYDAINRMGLRIRDLNPRRCSILIVTDGDENQSVDRSGIQANAVLDWLRALGYQVTFMGCDFDNSHQAKTLGASPSNSIGVQKRLLTDAAKNFAKKRSNYTQFGTDINFSEEERTKFGGFLGGPSKKDD